MKQLKLQKRGYDGAYFYETNGHEVNVTRDPDNKGSWRTGSSENSFSRFSEAKAHAHRYAVDNFRFVIHSIDNRDGQPHDVTLAVDGVMYFVTIPTRSVLAQRKAQWHEDHGNLQEVNMFPIGQDILEFVDLVDFAREAQCDHEQYLDFVRKTNPALADFAEFQAHDNTFTMETHDEYRDDLHRWQVALATARLVVDCPSDYGFDG